MEEPEGIIPGYIRHTSSICCHVLCNQFFEKQSRERKRLFMQITDLKIRKMMTEGRLRAIVSITLDQMLAVHDIKVVQGEERLFVAMPSRKDEAGVFRDVVHPISPEARSYLETQILDAYEKQLALQMAETEAETSAEEPL